MASTKPVIRRTLLLWVLMLGLISCSTPKTVLRTEQYHEPQPGKEAARILNGLQLKALQLMNQQKFNEAISFLQRAIKVEPRDALNWHYLAQNYWHLKEYKNCRAMLNRAISYSQFDADLSRANRTLMTQCSP